MNSCPKEVGVSLRFQQILGIRFFDGDVEGAIEFMCRHGGFLVSGARRKNLDIIFVKSYLIDRRSIALARRSDSSPATRFRSPIGPTAFISAGFCDYCASRECSFRALRAGLNSRGSFGSMARICRRWRSNRQERVIDDW
jgi:hypothetical protein